MASLLFLDYTAWEIEYIYLKKIFDFLLIADLDIVETCSVILNVQIALKYFRYLMGLLNGHMKYVLHI